MRVLVFGGGAVGLGLAAPLIRAGADVSILARPATAAALAHHGLQQTGLFGDHRADQSTFTVGSDLAPMAAEPVDYVLVCTKSFDTTAAARSLANAPHLFGPRTRVVLCQNGWGNAELFAETFPRWQILNARVITGFARPAPHHVAVTVHAQPVHVGSIFDPATLDTADLCEPLTRGGLPTRPSPSLVQDLWAKMAYNCALNPLGAILGVDYGTLAGSPHARGTMGRLIDEVFAVTAAAGYPSHFASPDDYRQLFYGDLVPRTASHRSSMLQDITAGRPTEIDAINGSVVRLGDAHGVPTPTNRALCELIRFIDARPPSRPV
jgi:2-dehydropantoate 2-reductase